MPDVSPSSAEAEATLRVFEAALAAALPFREDGALLGELREEVLPVLLALARGYRIAEPPYTGPLRSTLSEGFALFNLLCRRAGLLGATPTACLALARATLAALRSQGLTLPAASADDLSVVAVEGYSAGRDEWRERNMRTVALESQVFFAFAPRCYGVFLAGSHHSEALARLLDEVARAMFRAEARSVLLDVSRLREHGEDAARAIVAFASTLTGLGVTVSIYESSTQFDAWFSELDLASRAIEHSRDFAEALAGVLAAAGYELRARGRLGELLDVWRTRGTARFDKVRAGSR